jgi:iron complex outermembrane receptor protein
MKNGILCFGMMGMVTMMGVLSATAQSQAAPSGAVTVPTANTNVDQNPAPPHAASPTSSVDANPSEQQMAPIIVTGSAIPTTDTEGASPVAVVDAATIQKRGYQTVEDVLRNLPANGSFASPGQSSLNFAPGAAYASLYGLGPQATLVLINGRRVANYAEAANGQYAFVDLNSIPALIVDRVEVLTEGTALYGADAVAGVINIITKKTLGDENGEFDAYFGNTTNKDAFLERYTLEGNLSSFDKNGFGIVEADFEHQNSTLASDIPISSSANQGNNGGFDLRSGRIFPGYFLGETDGNEFSINPGVGDVPLTGTTPATDHNVNGNYNTYDYNPDTSVIPETDRYGVYLNYTYKFYDGAVTPNIDFDYRHNRTILQEAPGGYSFFDGDTGPTEFSPAAGAATFQVPTSNPFNKTGEVIDVLSYRFVPIGNRQEDVDGDVFRAVPSVDIKLGDGWTLNAGFNYNYSFLNDRAINFPSASGFQAALNDTNPASAYNPFTGSSQQSAAAINSVYASSGDRSTSSLIAEDFRINGKLFDLPAGPVQMAFGGEYRLERYNQAYTEQDLTGDIISSSVQLDTAASQKDLSGYTQVDIPLTSPAFNIPGFYSTDVQVTGRVDKYSQFGSTENPQVALRWETIPGLVLRGSYSTAFRAPSLNELAAGGNQAYETIFDPVYGALHPGSGGQNEVLINTPGNPKLQPETAEVFSAGVAYSPEALKGFLITADFFKIRYSNQIQEEDAQTLIDEHSPNVSFNPDGTVKAVEVTYENLTSSYIDGVDEGFSYVVGDPNGSWGQFSFALNGTVLLEYVTNDPVLGPMENVGQDSGGLGPYSRYRQDTSLTYDYHNFSFTLDNDYASGYRDTSVEPYGIERGVAAYCVFNAQTSYTFDKEDIDKWAPGPRDGSFDWRDIVAGSRIALGCDNLYNFSPPFTANPSDTLGYDQTYADGTGRFVYVELTKKF